MSPLPYELTAKSERITPRAAMEIVERASERALELGLAVTICVVDPDGGLVAALRLLGAHDRTVNYAKGKATYSAGSGKTTEWFIENRLSKNDVLWRALSEDPETFLVPGGYPLLRDGRTVGAVGVSGGAFHEDVKIASYAFDVWEEMIDSMEKPKAEI